MCGLPSPVHFGFSSSPLPSSSSPITPNTFACLISDPSSAIDSIPLPPPIFNNSPSLSIIGQNGMDGGNTTLSASIGKSFNYSNRTSFVKDTFWNEYEENGNN